MIKILDTTLRDGSYVIDFQFSQDDTKNISKALESFNIDYIEIGHGLGLGAYRIEKYKSFCDDKEYLKVIDKSKKTAKYGVFFIPEIGNFQDIDLAIKYGIDFIRIGTNANESEKGDQYIKYAKSKGLKVAANYMKSYSISPEEFAKRAKKSYEIGADFIYLVDSAGGMLPEEVKKYIEETKKLSKCEIGFHGHNNLTLAVANSLIAIEAGATIIDSSLQGLGRDGGNASTEVLLSILIKKSLIKKQCLNSLFDYSEMNILPLLKTKGIDSMPLISGIGLFHSSFYPLIKELSSKHNVDSREVILKLSKINIVNPNKNDILEAIKSILARKDDYKNISCFDMKKSFDKIDGNFINNLMLLLKDISSIGKKLNKKSVLNIVVTKSNNIFVSNYIQESVNYIVGSCQINSNKLLDKIIALIDGNVDIVFYDAENKINESLNMSNTIIKNIKKSKIFFYIDTELWAKAIENLILIKSNFYNKNIYVNNTTEIGKLLASSLKKFSFNVFEKLIDSQKLDFLIGMEFNEIDENYIKCIGNDTIIIDGGLGSITNGFLDYCHDKKIEVIRVDMRAVLESEIFQKEKSYHLVNYIQGKRNLESFSYIAGGYYGKNGDIVVDSINNPACVIGISNGYGYVKYQLNNEEVKKVDEFEKQFFIEGIIK